MARGGQEHLEPEAAGHRHRLSLGVLPSVGVTSWQSRPATHPPSCTIPLMKSKLISFGIMDFILISLSNAVDVL